MHEHCCHYRHCCVSARGPGPDGEELAAEPLTISIGRPTTTLAVVRPVGEIDMGTAPEWERALHAAVALVAPDRSPAACADQSSGGSPEVLCDLDGLGFLSAAGVTVLLTVDALARSLGVVLVVVAAPGGPAGRVLALTDVDRRLHRSRALSDPRTIVRLPSPRPPEPARSTEPTRSTEISPGWEAGS